MKKLLSILILCLILKNSAHSQGCVAIRGAGGAACSMMDHMFFFDDFGDSSEKQGFPI
jgi:hypothetical protein